MRSALRLFPLLLLLLAWPGSALAGHTTDPATGLTPLGHIVEPRLAFAAATSGQDPDIHTDIAFWGNLAIQGNWDGFNIRDISNPAAPTQVSRTFCNGSQGDVAVYRNIIVRAWDSPAPNSTGPNAQRCDGELVPTGFEGLHIWDATNLADPVLVQQLPTSVGAHTTAALFPDLANNRVLVYTGPSGGSTLDIVAIPLGAPQNAAVVRTIATGGSCHDVNVILGTSNMMACAGGNGFRVFSLGGPRGGSFTNPELMYAVRVPCPGAQPVGCGTTGNVTIGHSASFSWNGDIIIFGHEPGGGTDDECEATDSPEKKSFFFYRSSDGVLLGRWTLPRPQGPNENCTLHNYNTVPFLDRHVLVHGSYQAGTGVIDFTNPAAPVELAFTDPPPEPTPVAPNPSFCSAQCALGGAWATYWYNGPLWETHISEGLNVWAVNNQPWWNNAVPLEYLNPQTQDALITCEGVVRGPRLVARRNAMLRITLRAIAVTPEGEGPAVAARNVAVRLRGAGINRTVRTNSSGRATLTVRPTRAGTIRLSATALNMEPCTTSLRVNRPPRAGGGTGGAGAGGGAGLTGRVS